MVLEIATALLGLAMTEVVVTWFHFAGVRRLSQIGPWNGHNRSLRSEFHTPSVSQRLVGRFLLALR